MSVKTCPKCGATKPRSEFGKNRSKKDGLQSVCNACRLEYRQANREKETARATAWAKENPERKEKYYKDYYAANRDKKKAEAKKWGAENKERKRQTTRAWNKANPEKYKRLGQRASGRRRARKHENGVLYVSDKDMRRLRNSPCIACGATEKITEDHIIPLARGGRHSIGNLQPLCRSCNGSKNASLMIEWRARKRGDSKEVT